MLNTCDDHTGPYRPSLDQGVQVRMAQLQVLLKRGPLSRVQSLQVLLVTVFCTASFSPTDLSSIIINGGFLSSWLCLCR